MKKAVTLQIDKMQGKEIASYINDLALLRTLYFHDYPYLYVANVQYERSYAAALAQNEKSFLGLLKDEEIIEGAITGLPLKDASEEFSRAFVENKLIVEGVYFLREIMLHKAFQGHGYGTKLVEAFEEFARANGYEKIVVSEVEESPNDPQCPAGYVSIEQFWEKMGFERVPNVTTYCNWKEVGGDAEISHPMFFMQKVLK
jgi:GNAT superfamily N-acetyltransferase